MIRDLNDSTQQRISHQGDAVYEYLQQSAVSQSPLALIQKFQNLLQQGRNADVRVSQALEKIIFAHQEEFDLFLSQCFYTILDVWIARQESLTFIGELLNILNVVSQSRSYDRRRKQLIQRVDSYQQSKPYQQLQQIISIIHPHEAIANSLDNSLNTNGTSDDISRRTPLISSYLVRYTFLYPYLLPDNIAADNLIEQIEQLQRDRQQDFEIKLSKHIIYRFRLKQVAKMKMMAKGAGKIITRADNPSLLSERAFRVAMQQYIGKNEGSTLQERSQLFITENEYRPTYKVFKQDLYRFLIGNIKPRNTTFQFDSRLEQKMTEIFPQAANKPLNRTQTLQTCRQLYSFLIVDSASNNNPVKFAELVANLGTAQVMALLLKLVLICPESKADLSRKIALVAKHYQHQTVVANPWLLKSLEHLLMAFSIYFGKIDVSIAKSAVR